MNYGLLEKMQRKKNFVMTFTLAHMSNMWMNVDATILDAILLNH